MTESHSQRTMKTLALMGTSPADWERTPIRWVQEERQVLADIPCPDCEGVLSVWVKVDQEGTPIRRPLSVAPEHWRRFGPTNPGALFDRSHTKIHCTRCTKVGRGGDRGRPTGRVREVCLMRVWVGHPVWPRGTKFDGRFSGNPDRYCCELCSKTLTSMASGAVAVMGRDRGGVWHGLWVGSDCARKFLQLKPDKWERRTEYDYVIGSRPELKMGASR